MEITLAVWWRVGFDRTNLSSYTMDMKVNEYIGDQFVKNIFVGNEIECQKEKIKLDKEREIYLEEYKKICKDKCYMNINYRLA